MKKFLAILLVFIVSVGVLAGTLVGIQSKGFRNWEWTQNFKQTLKSKFEKLKFWEKEESPVDNDTSIDKDTDIYNDLVNTSVLATSFRSELGRGDISNYSNTAWTYEKSSFFYPYFKYDNQDNVTSNGSYKFDPERAKLVIDKNDTNLMLSGNFLINGKRSDELWGKFGFQFIDSNGNGVFYFVNAFGEEGTELENIKGTKVCVVPIEKYTYNWNNVLTPVVSVDGEELNNFNNKGVITLGALRKGSDFTFYLNNYPVHTISTSIESFETIYPEVFTMNIDLQIIGLSCYKYLDVELENQTKVYDKTYQTWIYELEKGGEYNVLGLVDGVNYNTIQCLNGKSLSVYKNKVDKLVPNINLETAEIVDLTSENFGDNTFNNLASFSSFYDKNLFNLENNIFSIDGDLADGKGCFWQNEENETFYLWRAPVEVDGETSTTTNDYFTFIFTDVNGNIGSFNFRYTI